MIKKSILILFLLVYKSSFSQTIEYNGKYRYKIEQALELIKSSDPSYYQILSSVADKISISKYRFSYQVLDSLGSDWIMIQESMLSDDDYKCIAGAIIHESLHLFYRSNGQYLNFVNTYEEEIQAYSYERNFLIEVGGKKYDIQWCSDKIREYKAKSGT